MVLQNKIEVFIFYLEREVLGHTHWCSEYTLSCPLGTNVMPGLNIERPQAWPLSLNYILTLYHF